MGLEEEEKGAEEGGGEVGGERRRRGWRGEGGEWGGEEEEGKGVYPSYYSLPEPSIGWLDLPPEIEIYTWKVTVFLSRSPGGQINKAYNTITCPSPTGL